MWGSNWGPPILGNYHVEVVFLEVACSTVFSACVAAGMHCCVYLRAESQGTIFHFLLRN